MARSSLNLRPAAIISYDKNKDKGRGGLKSVSPLQSVQQKMVGQRVLSIIMAHAS